MSSLLPVRGSPAEIHELLRGWLRSGVEPGPLAVETSGSIGEPKRVLLSRAAVVASATATHVRLGGRGQWLLAVPARHVAGLQVLARSVLAGVRPVLLDDHPDLPAAVTAMTGPRRYLSLVPTQLTRLLGSPRDVAALRSLDAVLVGGAAVPPGTRAAAADAGLRLVATYGMSETCGGCVYDGVALDGVGVGVGTDGRIRIGGPVLFDGYDGRPDLTAQVLHDGELLTADLGRVDHDGRLEVLGRVDDVVVSGGVNVPGAAVAARLREHPAVAEAEVVGVPDEEWGHRVVAAVVCSGPPPSLADLRDFVGERLPRAWAPRDLCLLRRLPLLDNGKVDRRALLMLASDGRGSR